MIELWISEHIDFMKDDFKKKKRLKASASKTVTFQRQAGYLAWARH
jgi:hypothetical protein